MLDRPAPSPPTTDTWTPERVAILTRMWVQEGASSGEIVAALGGAPFTRNSIIGKAKRLKLQQGRRSPALPPKQNGNRGIRKVPAMVHRVITRREVHVEEAIDPGVDVTHLLGLVQLNQHTCRWPIGDPRSPHFGFCGKSSVEGKPYCAEHCAAAYQPR